MRCVVIAELAAGDIERILRRSETAFGAHARRRYRALIDHAIRDVADDPDRPGVRAIDGVRAGYASTISASPGAGTPVRRWAGHATSWLSTSRTSIGW